jgi:hypothetical protein
MIMGQLLRLAYSAVQRPWRIDPAWSRLSSVYRLAILVFLTVTTAAAPSRAASPLTIAPASVAVDTGSSSSVIVSAPVGARISKGALPTLLDPQGPVHMTASMLPRKGGQAAWLVHLSLDPAQTSETDATLALRMRDGSTNVASVHVVPKAAPAVASMVTGAITLDGDTLYDGDTARLALRLTNETDTPFEVQRARFVPSQTFDASFADQGTWQLPPHQTIVKVAQVTIRSDHALVSGKHPISILVTLARQSPSHPWFGDLMVTDQLGAGVPGIAEMQNLIGVPTFLLLPGALLVISFLMVWQTHNPPAEAKGMLDRLAVAWSPSLWLVAITASILIVAIYPYVTGIWGPRRYILYGFDLRDVGIIWFSCVAIGAAAGGIALAIQRCRQKAAAAQLFQAGEAPWPFLERLAGMRIASLRFAAFRAGAGYLHRLTDADADGLRWLAPAIRVDAAGLSDDEKIILGDAIRDGTVEAVITLLAQHGLEGNLTWQPADNVAAPVHRADGLNGTVRTNQQPIMVLA